MKYFQIPFHGTCMHGVFACVNSLILSMLSIVSKAFPHSLYVYKFSLNEKSEKGRTQLCLGMVEQSLL